MNKTWARIIKLMQTRPMSQKEAKIMYNKIYNEDKRTGPTFNKAFSDMRDDGLIELHSKYGTLRRHIPTTEGMSTADEYDEAEDLRALVKERSSGKDGER